MSYFTFINSERDNEEALKSTLAHGNKLGEKASVSDATSSRRAKTNRTGRAEREVCRIGNAEEEKEEVIANQNKDDVEEKCARGKTANAKKSEYDEEEDENEGENVDKDDDEEDDDDLWSHFNDVEDDDEYDENDEETDGEEDEDEDEENQNEDDDEDTNSEVCVKEEDAASNDLDELAFYDSHHT